MLGTGWSIDALDKRLASVEKCVRIFTKLWLLITQGSYSTLIDWLRAWRRKIDWYVNGICKNAIKSEFVWIHPSLGGIYCQAFGWTDTGHREVATIITDTCIQLPFASSLEDERQLQNASGSTASGISSASQCRTRRAQRRNYGNMWSGSVPVSGVDKATDHDDRTEEPSSRLEAVPASAKY